jgi:2-iminoacetate synthase ThiH
MLDNVDNIKALWNYLGLDTAKEALQWGANDLASTSLEEKIITMAGGVQIKMTPRGMEEIISSMGRTPMKVTSAEMKTALC